MLRHPFDPLGRVAPALNGVAAWLASIREDVFDGLLRADPEVLFLADLSMRTEKQRAALVEWLFDQARVENPFVTRFGASWSYRRLRHANIAKQLQCIFNRAEPRLVRHVAVQIADACEGAGLTSRLTDLALQETEPLALRAAAAWCVAHHGSLEDKGRLMPLALKPVSGDQEGNLQWPALSAVWPEHATWPQMEGVIATVHYSSLQPVGRFISDRLAQAMPIAAIPRALTWLSNNLPQVSGGPYALENFTESLISRAVDQVNDPAVRAPLVELLFQYTLEKYAMPYRHSALRGERNLFGPLEGRYLIASDLIPCFAATPRLAFSATRGSSPPLLCAEDLPFVLASWRSASAAARPAWETVIDALTNWRDAEECEQLVRIANGERGCRHASCWARAL
jgi:hypothetical protein